MINESSAEINPGFQDVSIGVKVKIKICNAETEQLKYIFHTIGQANNISDIKTKVQNNTKFDQIYLFFKDIEGKQMEYSTDEQILEQLAMKNKIMYRVLPQSLKKAQSDNVKQQNISSIIPSSPKVQSSDRVLVSNSCMLELEIKSQQPQDLNSLQQQLPNMKYRSQLETQKQRSQLPIKKLKSRQLQKQEKQGKRSEGSQLVSNLQQVIDKILKSHIADIAQQLFPSSNDNPNTLFNLTCTFCKKFELRNRIFACHENHQVVACQSCSQYLHYQLPLPFDIYTSPSEYEKARSQQPKQTSSSFLEKLQQQKQIRNETIKSKLNDLPTLSIKTGK